MDAGGRLRTWRKGHGRHAAPHKLSGALSCMWPAHNGGTLQATERALTTLIRAMEGLRVAESPVQSQ